MMMEAEQRLDVFLRAAEYEMLPDLKELVVQRYALFIEDVEGIHKRCTEEKVFDTTKYQNEVFEALRKVRLDLDAIIGHDLVEKLFGTDGDVVALYYQ
jgi:hypothetical protein